MIVIDISRLMPVDLELSPKQKQAAGERWAYYYVIPDALEELSAWLG
jgi:hypothetical protein